MGITKTVIQFGKGGSTLNFYFKLPSNRSFDETVTAVKKALSEINYDILWEFNFKEKFESRDISFPGKFLLIEACNPDKARQLLSHELSAGFFLPCRVVVFEENGIVQMGILQLTELLSPSNNEGLLLVAKDIEVALSIVLLAVQSGVDP